MNLTPNTNNKWMRWVTTLILICILVFLGVKNVDTVSKIVWWCVKLALPLVIGAAIALIIDVPMRFLETYLWKKTKNSFLCAIRRPIAFILSLLFILGILIGVVMIIIPELIESIKIIVLGAIDMISKVDAMTEEELAALPFGNIINSIDWNQILESLQKWLKDQSSVIVRSAFSTLSSVITAIFDLVVAFAFGIYLLFSKDKLKGQMTRAIRVWLPKRFGNWLIHACNVAITNFRNFISGQTLEALILGTLCMLGMLAFNIPYAPMVSVLVGITALIPVIGGFIGGGIGAFMILTVDPSKALFFIIFLIILQQLEGNLIYPKVMGRRVNLPGIWILAAVTLGGGICGPIGMLISVPITSTAYVLIKEATNKREEEMAQNGASDKEDAQEKNVSTSLETKQEEDTSQSSKAASPAEAQSSAQKENSPKSARPKEPSQKEKKQRKNTDAQKKK